MVKLHIKNHSDIFPFSKDKYSFVSSKKKKKGKHKSRSAIILHWSSSIKKQNKSRTASHSGKASKTIPHNNYSILIAN